MAIAHLGAVGAGVQSTLTTTHVVTMTAAVAVGKHAIMPIANSTGSVTVTSVVDSRGNAWQEDVSEVYQSTGLVYTVRSCKVATALQIGDTITITYSGALQRGAAFVDAFDDLATAGWYEAHAPSAQQANSGSMAITPADASEHLVYHVVAGQISGGHTITLSGCTQTQGLDSNDGRLELRAGYEIVSAVASVGASWTSTAGATLSSGDVSIAYKGLAAAGPGPRSRIVGLLG